MDKTWLVAKETYRREVKNWSFLLMIFAPFLVLLISFFFGMSSSSAFDSDTKVGIVSQNQSIVQPLKKTEDFDLKVRDYMCENFFDIRTFGAVMTTFVKDNLNCGQVRGPVQLSFAKSVDPVIPQEITITRVAITTEKDAEGKKTEMGRKYIVPYGLYYVEGYISANIARKVTGFSEEDLELLWQAIINMFELDHSAARGNMSVRKLIVFKHNSEFGNAPAYQLFERIKVKRKDETKPARCFGDYEVEIDSADMPDGVECIEKL